MIEAYGFAGSPKPSSRLRREDGRQFHYKLMETGA
jgi:hypothetical protein